MIKKIFSGIIFFGLLAFSFLNPAKHDSTASLIGAGAGVESSDREETFAEPVDVIWSGKIISTMTGGECIGLENLTPQTGPDRPGGYSKFIACLPEGNPRTQRAEQSPYDGQTSGLWKFSGNVTIAGEWTGITCAYKNTIFGGCVPEVVIENIK